MPTIVGIQVFLSLALIAIDLLIVAPRNRGGR
jgi:hypothetical protein